MSYCSHVQLFATLWTVAHQTPLSMGFSREEYWNGLLFPSPGDLPDSGIEPTSLLSPALAGGIFTLEPPRQRHTLQRKKRESNSGGERLEGREHSLPIHTHTQVQRTYKEI